MAFAVGFPPSRVGAAPSLRRASLGFTAPGLTASPEPNTASPAVSMLFVARCRFRFFLKMEPPEHADPALLAHLRILRLACAGPSCESSDQSQDLSRIILLTQMPGLIRFDMVRRLLFFTNQHSPKLM
jgi:hypothetical protein